LLQKKPRQVCLPRPLPDPGRVAPEALLDGKAVSCQAVGEGITLAIVGDGHLLLGALPFIGRFLVGDGAECHGGSATFVSLQFDGVVRD